MEFTMPEDGICTVCQEEAKLLPMAWNEPPTRCYSCFVEQAAFWEALQEMKDEEEDRHDHDQT